MTTAVDIVKRAIRLQAVHLSWPSPGIMDAIREREAAKQALAQLPQLEIASHPLYPSVDEGQSGFILGGHLTPEQWPALPLHIANEMLDELATSAGGANHDSPREYQRAQVLAAYGSALAEIVCQGIDEALLSAEAGHKRLRDWDGKRFAPLDSTELDEPLYEDCDPADEYATPATSFDFYDAIGGASELIEQRDKAAAAARRGENAPAAAPSDEPLAAAK